MIREIFTWNWPGVVDGPQAHHLEPHIASVVPLTPQSSFLLDAQSQS